MIPDQDKEREIFRVPGIPEQFAAQSWKALAPPDDIEVGDLLMCDSSLEVLVEVMPEGVQPRVRLNHGPPIPPGPFTVLAYDFPFLAVKCEAGPHQGNRFPVDVRMHHFIRLRPEFLAALVPPKKPRPALPEF